MGLAQRVPRKVLICLAVAGVGAAVVPPLASGGTETVEIQATIEVTTTQFPGGGCGVGAAVQVPDVPDATTYTVIVFDNGRETTATMPPFDDSQAPAGYHRAGLAGYTQSAGDCAGGEQGYRDRFKAGPATATIAFPSIEGRVVDEGGHGVPDVRIDAKGPAKLSAVTDFDGGYVIEVPDDALGSYKVEPRKSCKRSCRGGYDPTKTKVEVADDGTARADFTERCAIGRQALRAKRFTPENGLYQPAGGDISALAPGFAVSLYYQCAKKTLFANVEPAAPNPPFSCVDGVTRSPVDFPVQTGPIKLGGERAFAFRERLNGKTLRVLVSGRFETRKRAEISKVRLIQSGQGVVPACTYEDDGTYLVDLVDDNPTPFRAP